MFPIRHHISTFDTRRRTKRQDTDRPRVLWQVEALVPTAEAGGKYYMPYLLKHALAVWALDMDGPFGT